jgi:hypothetical protein
VSSAWRSGLAAVVLLAATSVALMALGADWSAVAGAKAEALAEAAQDRRGFGRRRGAPVVIDSQKVDYDGRFAFVRLRYDLTASGFLRRDLPWAHDYPRADFHFLKILGEITLTRTFVDEGNILTLDDPDLAMFPIAYMSEPGHWTMGEAEMEGLRAYLQKGGFVIFDDFRDNHMDNLVAQMRRVLPEANWRPLDATHPIFHSFFEINSLDPSQGYYGPAEWSGIFEDNDPAKRLMAIANYNHDLGEMWEFSDTGYLPVDVSNEAYKFGVNYVIYAMTH